MASSQSEDSSNNGDISPCLSLDAEICSDVGFSVNLLLPKFTHDCDENDFMSALGLKIDIDDIKYLGKKKYSNEWQVTLKTTSARDTLLQTGTMSIKSKKCIIFPCQPNQVCGRVHWLPVDVSDEVVKDILQNFGEVLKFIKERISPEPDAPYGLTRFFILNLSDGCSKDDIPHFISINKNQGMITVKGRNPRCLKCGEVGHRKSKCPKEPESVSKRHVKNKAPVSSKDKKVSTNEAHDNNPSKNKKSSSVLANTGTTPNSLESLPSTQSSKDNIHNVASEVKHLQDLMTLFSQKMNEVLSDVGCTLNSSKSNVTQQQPAVEEAIASSSAANSNITNKQSKKKRKKKCKTSDHYDLTATELVNDNLSSGQHSPKGSLDSGIAINGHTKSTNTSICAGDNEWIEPLNNTEVSNCVKSDSTSVSSQKRKKKNKKKSSNASTIPGLTLP